MTSPGRLTFEPNALDVEACQNGGVFGRTKRVRWLPLLFVEAFGRVYAFQGLRCFGSARLIRCT
jgi:hypothetical protein